eukprot:TRINITY_DN21855_c0_g1_i1.p1 TRINITY_DN21855_c0_g1~~TRINITY_DN21855_c0_g1_i1.p1  ORF type:complete len:520 (+),score=183.02 TRINITY_DN21855_c0_g1_i1:54-1613(+)
MIIVAPHSEKSHSEFPRHCYKRTTTEQQTMSTIKVNVKWGKQKFDNIELNLNEPPLTFKNQLFSLTGVLPEKQKIMLKGGLLKDDSDWSKFGIKEGHVFMLVGTAEENLVKPPSEKTVFVEDMSEDQTAAAAAIYPPGLVNLGNTCYMNSTVQCFKAVPELRTALKKYKESSNTQDTTVALTAQARDLFGNMKRSHAPVNPLTFLLTLRSAFPQFNQTGNNGQHMQQDAEECWTQLMLNLSKKLDKFGAKEGEKASLTENAVNQLFSGDVVSTMTNTESAEEAALESVDTFIKLPCHISNSTNYLLEGLKEGMQEKITKNSSVLGREAEFLKTSKISRLPYYLTIQFVRFFWKSTEQTKAKILKPVEYPMTLDMYELCSEDLKQQLMPKRREAHEIEDKIQEHAKKPKTEKSDKMEVDSKPKDEAEEQADYDPLTFKNETGFYELSAVLTHKGRSADSGHYVAWVKDRNDTWLKFDDDTVTPVPAEEVKKLSGKGGGDWHIAYLALYKSKPFPTVPTDQ